MNHHKSYRIIEDGNSVHLHLDSLPTTKEIKYVKEAVQHYVRAGKICYGMIAIECPQSVRKVAKLVGLEHHFSDDTHECWSSRVRLG